MMWGVELAAPGVSRALGIAGARWALLIAIACKCHSLLTMLP